MQLRHHDNRDTQANPTSARSATKVKHRSSAARLFPHHKPDAHSSCV
jgi:hypothetical protein